MQSLEVHESVMIMETARYMLPFSFIFFMHIQVAWIIKRRQAKKKDFKFTSYIKGKLYYYFCMFTWDDAL